MNKLARTALFFLMLSPFFFLLFKIAYQRFAMFGCFDECFNYLAGYFMLGGKVLYKNYFFNHQMLMPYLSSLIQLILHPQSIYHLVLYHKIFIFVFATLMNILLIYRFGLLGVGFTLLFEATKFYFMGSLFIPESLVVYFLVYLLGICWQKLMGRNVTRFDYVASGVFAWLVTFLREPYILAALLIYIIILWGKKTKVKYVSLGVFIFLSIVILLATDLKSYLYQVFLINSQVLSNESRGIFSNFGFLKVFFYPIYVFLAGKTGYLRNILVGLSLIFVISSGILSIRFGKIKQVLSVLLILGVSNARFVAPGTTFYEAFHMLPWYGLFVISTLLFIRELFELFKHKLIPLIVTFSFVAIIIYSLIPGSFFAENLNVSEFNRNRELKLEFDKYLINGEAVRLLSVPGDTLFIDIMDNLIYWQAKLDSPYKYTTYMGPDSLVFQNARLEMFRNNPPDFYYYSCSDKQYESPYLPDFVANDYAALYYINRPSCLYVKKAKLSKITYEMWDKLKILRFYPPEVKI